MASGVYKRNKPVWNKGLPMSEETKRKLSFKFKGRKAPWMLNNKHIVGTKNPNYGKFGKAHPCWKDFKKHQFHKSIRQTFMYRQWRSDIFTRDDYTCTLCGVRGGYIEADHHPKRFIEIISECNIKTVEESFVCEELWNLNNGRTLCKKCHDPTRGRTKKNLTNLKNHG